MTGTIPAKIARLGLNLLAHPDYSRRFLKHNLLRRQPPLELELPWFSYAAIDFLERHLKPTMVVGEYGSGGSTLFFARRTRFVYSVEDNAEWYERITRRLNEKRISNVRVKLCPFNFKNPVGFERSGYLHALPEDPLDVIVIDGSEEWEQVRPMCFWHAERFVKPGGLIVVDDSWRYPELREQHKAERVRIFQSVGPGRPGVTSTDVFCY